VKGPTRNGTGGRDLPGGGQPATGRVEHRGRKGVFVGRDTQKQISDIRCQARQATPQLGGQRSGGVGPLRDSREAGLRSERRPSLLAHTHAPPSCPASRHHQHHPHRCDPLLASWPPGDTRAAARGVRHRRCDWRRAPPHATGLWLLRPTGATDRCLQHPVHARPSASVRCSPDRPWIVGRWPPPRRTPRVFSPSLRCSALEPARCASRTRCSVRRSRLGHQADGGLRERQRAAVPRGGPVQHVRIGHPGGMPLASPPAIERGVWNATEQKSMSIPSNTKPTHPATHHYSAIDHQIIKLIPRPPRNLIALAGPSASHLEAWRRARS
jgi:hypothetical protein